MNKEQQELLDEVYKNFVDETKGLDFYLEINKDIIVVEGPVYNATPRLLTKEEFINKCKTDTEFSKQWGLKIDERELTTVRERKKYDIHFDDLIGEYPDHHETLDKRGVPRKLITITYKETKIESYE